MLQPQKKIFGEKIYPWLILILPIICVYSVGPLALDVVFMALFFLCSLFFRRHIRISPISQFALVLMAYMTLIYIINLVFGQKFSPASDSIVRFGRYLMYLMIVFFLGNECISYESLMKAYRFVAYAATVYVIIQAALFYGAGITLPTRIGGDLSSAETEVGRLRSFYSEPAILGYALVPFVVCSLFGRSYLPNQKNVAFDAIFITGAIILSTSGQGIAAAAAVWALWIVIQVINGTFKARQLLLILGIAVVAVILYKTGILEFALGRMEDTDEGSAIDARMSGYEALKVLSPLQFLFGSGFGNFIVANTYELDIYYEFINYSTISEFLFTLGVIGTALWVVFFAYLFRKGNACARVLILALLILSVFGCPMTGLLCPLWLTLICLQLPEGQFSRIRSNLS